MGSYLRDPGIQTTMEELDRSLLRMEVGKEDTQEEEEEKEKTMIRMMTSLSTRKEEEEEEKTEEEERSLVNPSLLLRLKPKEEIHRNRLRSSYQTRSIPSRASYGDKLKYPQSRTIRV